VLVQKHQDEPRQDAPQLFGFSSQGLWPTTRRINAVSVAAHAKNSADKFAFFDSDYDVDAQNKKERD
jgi:hypothetical protein